MSAFTDKVKFNCHFPAACRNCMTHHKALTVVVATISFDNSIIFSGECNVFSSSVHRAVQTVYLLSLRPNILFNYIF